MSSSVRSCNTLPEAPVFAAQFTGRIRLAQNLLRRCLHRQSILLDGGPKLGKTSMLLHLKWLMDQAHEASSTIPAAEYLDLSDKVTHTQLLRCRAGSTPVLLLDNCDHLMQHNRIDLLRELIKSESMSAMICTGAHAWHDVVADQRLFADFRRAPLAVLLPSEAAELLKPGLTSNQISATLSAGGTHPYILKMIAHHMLSFPGDLMCAIRTVGEQLVPFLQSCRQAVARGIETALLDYLIHEARPVNPRKAAEALGVPTIKSPADALCCIGLISRWNLNEGAMLQANCQIFNEWWVATTRS